MDYQGWGNVMRSQLSRNRRPVLTGILATACLLQSVELPLATTTSTTFSVSVTLAATCTINSASALNFGNQGILGTNVDQTSTIQVTCTNTTPYNIGLDAGTGTGATVATRKLTSGGATVNYTLYSDTGRTTVWGTTIGTDTVAATGNGSGQNYTVYGRIPVQTTPAPGTYTDTITVTVTY
jgi:spore coat protein U-like protein